MHKVITFLGVYPRASTYTFRDEQYSGAVFAQVLRQFVGDFDEMLVFVTPAARTSALPALVELEDERIKPVDIPNGETPDEMWQTFNIVTEAVDDGDKVTFDITHGLRSIPFLVFLVHEQRTSVVSDTGRYETTDICTRDHRGGAGGLDAGAALLRCVPDASGADDFGE